jgi:hypothetical protein
MRIGPRPTRPRSGRCRIIGDVRSLSTDRLRPPAGFPVPWWRGLIRDAELFLATWGRQATDLGWTTLDLFGVHAKAAAARYSCMGLLLLARSSSGSRERV